MPLRPFIAAISIVSLVASAWVAAWHVHGGNGQDGRVFCAAHSHGHQSAALHCHHHTAADHSGHAHPSEEASRHSHRSGDVPWTPEHAPDDCRLCQFLAQNFGLVGSIVASPMVERVMPLACSHQILLLSPTVQRGRSRGPPPSFLPISS